MLTMAWFLDMVRYSWLLLHMRAASAGDSRRPIRHIDRVRRSEDVSPEFWQR